MGPLIFTSADRNETPLVALEGCSATPGRTAHVFTAGTRRDFGRL